MTPEEAIEVELHRAGEAELSRELLKGWITVGGFVAVILLLLSLGYLFLGGMLLLVLAFYIRRIVMAIRLRAYHRQAAEVLEQAGETGAE